MIRAYCGQFTTTIAMIALRMLGPRAAATTMAEVVVRKASTMSVIRMSTSSIQPPRYPATAPMTAPMTSEAMTRISADGIETQDPAMTQDSTSRQSASVPSR